jgi:hypothetical protein
MTHGNITMLKYILTTFIYVARSLRTFGIDAKAIAAFRHYPKYLKHKREWTKQGGKITKNFMILRDYDDTAGVSSGHYFHQDLLVAHLINEHKPKRHLDIGSRIDGFVAHVASFRKIEVIDVRPLEPSEHSNIHFIQADITQLQDMEKTDSLSCLHVIEHFGLGRYTDPIDVDGHLKGITNLLKLVEKNGRLYLSFPIGIRDEVHFNAHRVFHPLTILKHPDIVKSTKLLRFDFVNDEGNLLKNIKIDELNNLPKFGCGIYTFQKI